MGEPMRKFEAAVAAFKQQESPPSEETERFLEAEETLAQIKKLLLALPFLRHKMIARGLAEMDPPVSAGEPLEQVRRALAAEDVHGKAETEHLIAMLSTDDPLGIMLRGHVLVENALDLIMSRYLARPMNLHDELQLYFAGKVKLAYGLGILSEPEKEMLKIINKKRNRLVHEEPAELRSRPRYTFTISEEREVWTRFRDTIGKVGPWPEYDQAKFPLYLKIAVLGTAFRLTKRSNDIRDHKLGIMDDRFREPTLSAHYSAAVTILIVKLIPKLKQALRDSDMAQQT